MTYESIDLHATDVGDGLCLTLRARQNWPTVQVDCGSMQGGRYAAQRWFDSISPSILQHDVGALVLSHYHADHFNGWMWASNSARQFPHLDGLRQIFSPGVPDPPVTVPLLRAHLALAAYGVGLQSGVMAVEFGQIAKRLSSNPISHTRLFAGDVAQIRHGVDVSVLWPPRTLSAEAREAVKSAVRSFEEVINAPERRRLKRLYDEARDLLREESINADSELGGVRGVGPDERRELAIEGEVIDRYQADAALHQASRKLRAAANHLCLAFNVDRQVLFLGDLDSDALRAVVEYLVARQRLTFQCVVAPHHGTHWVKELYFLRARHVCVSVGQRLWRHVKPGIGRIGDHVHLTYLQGEICVR